MSRVASQNHQILAYLKRGHRLTPLDALKLFGSLRLGARVFDLRQAGHAIHSRRVPVGKDRWVAEYKLLRAGRS